MPVYNVMDVARYVINYCNDKNYDISNLRLQKLLYFIQAEYLSSEKDSQPCFNENIQAWNFGPVVPEVYHEFKEFGGGQIPKIDRYIVRDNSLLGYKYEKYEETIINSNDREKISDLIDELSQYSTTTLVDITHCQSPWKNAYNGNRDEVITKESIRKYFGK